MNNRLIAATICTICAVFAISPTVSRAESDSRATTGIIEEVVVTARRRDETAQSVPIPITVVSGEDLEVRGSLDMRDLERVTPNLSFKNTTVNRNTAQVFLRGVGQTNFGPGQDPKVGIYLDGVYMARSQGAVFDLIDIERVEVLRGPQGTLFGRNTTAGLVHVVTKRPVDTFEAEVRTHVGDDGQLGAAVTLNLPLTENLAARISAQHRESDGYVENRVDGSDWFDEDAQNARANFAWTPSDQFDAVLSLDYQRVREKPGLSSCEWAGGDDPSQWGGLEGLAVLGGFAGDIKATCDADRPYSGFEEDPNDSNKVDAWGAALTMTYDLSPNLQLTSVTAYRDIEDVNGSWGIGGDSLAGDTVSIHQSDDRPSKHDQFSQEFRLSGTAYDEKLTFVAGLYHFNENSAVNVQVPLFEGWVPPDCTVDPFNIACFPAFPGATFGDLILQTQAASNSSEYEGENESNAIFAEATYSFTDELSLTAGVRYTKDERKLSVMSELITGAENPGFICPDGSPPVARSCSKSDDWTETTPRVIVDYQLTDDVLLYGSWSKGYSSGGFNQDPALARYEPEISKNWELGMKSMFFDRRLRFNLTGYHNSYDNQQLTVLRTIRGQQVNVILNAQEATLYGVELELQALLGNWTFTFTGGTTEGEYDKFEVQDVLLGPPPEFTETVVTRDLSDNELVLGSPYTASLGIGYTMPLAESASLDFNVGYSYRGRQYNDLDARDNIRQDAYGLLDARVTWKLSNGRSSFSVVGNNLLDEEYFSLAFGETGAVRNGFYWAPPRRVRLEFRHYFGG